MNRIAAGMLNVAYLETGPIDGPPVILLHGFPYDPHAFDEAMSVLAKSGWRCIAPFLRGYGNTRFISSESLRSGQQAALAFDLISLMDALVIPTAVLAGFDWGGRAACIVAALWPGRVAGLVSCGKSYNIQNIAEGGRPTSAESELRSWYVYYLNTDRGRAGLLENRYSLCRLIWKHFSPTWAFGEATFERSFFSFDNPDFVDVVVHSYRHRLGAVAGDPVLDAIEEKLQLQPSIEVPTILLSGADDGVEPPNAADNAERYYPQLVYRKFLDGIGHNVPQEAPMALVEAVLVLGKN